MSAYAHNPSASKRLIAFVLFVIGVTLTVSLFYIKTRAQTAKDQVVKLERAIAQEEAAIAILRAELAVLESPERVATLAKDYLGHAPVSVKVTISANDIVQLIPLRETAKLNEGEGEIR